MVFILPFIIYLLFSIANPIRSSPIFETHFTKSSINNAPQQKYLQITHPLFSDFLYPTCNTLLLNHSFADTMGKPPVSATYSPPEDCNWSHAVLDFSVSCTGDQYDRIVGVWLNGTELLRTSTAEPTEDGVFWNVRKDITRYSSLLQKQDLTLTVMLENIVNDVFTGIYNVNVSILYYFNSPGNVPAPAPASVPAPTPSPFPVPIPSPFPVPIPSPFPVPVPGPASVPSPIPVPVPGPASVPVPVPSPFPVPVPGPSSVPVPIPSPFPVPIPEPPSVPEPTPSPFPVPIPSPFPVPIPSPFPVPVPGPASVPSPFPVPVPGVPVPVPSPFPVPVPGPSSVPEPIPSPFPEPIPEPPSVPEPTPLPFPVPIPSPFPVPIPSPFPVPVPGPASVPSPIPSPFPVPVPGPASVPVPVPSPFPVPIPGPPSVPEPFPAPLPLPVPAPEPSESAKHALKLIRKTGFQIESENVGKISMVTDILHDYNEKNVYESPADLIIPISGKSKEGFWFRIKNESDVKSQGIQIPSNTYKAILEVYVSFHGDDEFWYSNPPDSYIQSNNLTTGRGNGAYREVMVTIDGNLVGTVFPFPVIFTGGINPLFWEPVVAIGAFNLPSYNFLLTPFLGQLLDGKVHVFGLVVAGSIQYWLVDANLHLWLDQGSSEVQAKSIHYQPPSLEITRKSSFKHLDGSFHLKATRESEYAGWVNSSAGNLTTYIIQKLKFKNSIKFHNNGSKKSVEQKIKAKIEIRVEAQGMVMSRTKMKIAYPLDLSISNQPWSDDSKLMLTSVDHGLKAKFKGSDDISGSIDNKQKSDGWMIVRDHDVLSGSADTRQEYELKSELGCYWRKIYASNGWLIKDDSSFSCSSSSSS